ncbi:MAG: PhnD/SsuA/transferrin family substrate-binding protein [Myxococcota bacterium]
MQSVTMSRTAYAALSRCLALVPALALALAFTLSTDAHAQSAERMTVGLFAPTTPLGGPSQRVEFINDLAGHLSSATGKQVAGRVYSNARAFTSAVRNGAVQFAVVDAPYAAARRLPFRILAAATKGGNSTLGWQLIATGGVSNLADLKGKQVAVPQVGTRAAAFATNVLLEGEVDGKYFRKIPTAPNPDAAASMVSLGRADAALVPNGTSLPGGVSKVAGLRSVGLPMFVAMKGVADSDSTAFATAVRSYRGSGAITGFGSAKAGKSQALRGSFGKGKRRGVMAVPKPARLAVTGILGDRSFAIEPSDLRVLRVVPTPSSSKAAPSADTATGRGSSARRGSASEPGR